MIYKMDMVAFMRDSISNNAELAALTTDNWNYVLINQYIKEGEKRDETYRKRWPNLFITIEE